MNRRGQFELAMIVVISLMTIMGVYHATAAKYSLLNEALEKDIRLNDAIELQKQRICLESAAFSALMEKRVCEVELEELGEPLYYAVGVVNSAKEGCGVKLEGAVVVPVYETSSMHTGTAVSEDGNYIRAYIDGQGLQLAKNNAGIDGKIVLDIDCTGIARGSVPNAFGYNPSTGSVIGDPQAVKFSTNTDAACRITLGQDLGYGDMGAVDHWECASDAETPGSCEIEISGLGADGEKKLYVSCSHGTDPATEDSAGDNDEVKYILDVEYLFPAGMIISVGGGTIPPYSTSDTTPEVVMRMDDAVECRMSDRDVAFNGMQNDIICTEAGPGIFSCAVGEEMSSGENDLHVACKDDEGNRHTASNNIDIDFTIE